MNTPAKIDPQIEATIAALKAARDRLAVASEEEAANVLNQAHAAELVAHIRRCDALAREAAQTKLRAMARLGSMLPPCKGGRGVTAETQAGCPGFSPDDRKRFRMVAGASEFIDSYFKSCADSDSDPTREGLLRYARERLATIAEPETRAACPGFESNTPVAPAPACEPPPSAAAGAGADPRGLADAIRAKVEARPQAKAAPKRTSMATFARPRATDRQSALSRDLASLHELLRAMADWEGVAHVSQRGQDVSSEAFTLDNADEVQGVCDQLDAALIACKGHLRQAANSLHAVRRAAERLGWSL